jgi:hypothetical protein
MLSRIPRIYIVCKTSIITSSIQNPKGPPFKAIERQAQSPKLAFELWRRNAPTDPLHEKLYPFCQH